MIHDSEGLTLVRKTREHFASVHAQLDNFERYAATDGLLLLRKEHRTHSAFPDPAKHFVRTKPVAVGRILARAGGKFRQSSRLLARIERARDEAGTAQPAGTSERLFGTASWTDFQWANTSNITDFNPDRSGKDYIAAWL